LEDVMAVAALFTAVNVILLLALLWVYLGSFKKVRSQFTAGLVFFAALFLLQNLISLYSFLTMFMYYASDVTGLVLTISIVQTAGLGIILWTALR
jgi:hypothetical protein